MSRYVEKFQTEFAKFIGCRHALFVYDTMNIDPESVKEKITDRTRAIYVVHHCGCPVDMDPILEVARKRGIAVVEDCAHAIGA